MTKKLSKKCYLTLALAVIALICGVMFCSTLSVKANSSATEYKNEVTENGALLLASSDTSSQLVASNIVGINTDITNATPSSYSIKNVSSTGAANSSVWKMNFHSSNPTKGAAIQFSKSIALTEIDSITIRMNAHFSSSSSYIVGLGGVMITALETTSVDKDTNVHVINANVQQDTWIDYTISGSTLARLADGEGKINGIQIASHIASSKDSDFYIGTGGQDKSWLLVDYVYYTEYQPTALEKLRENGYLLASAHDGDHELVDKKLERMNGYDIVPGTANKGGAGVEVVDGAHANDAGDKDITWDDMKKGMVGEKAFRLAMHTSRTTLFGPAIKFTQEVKADEIGGITIRLFAILSSADTYQTTYGGIQLFGLNADGYGKGYMIPANITQNEWTELVITPEEAQLLADEDGYIRGVQFAAAFYSGNPELLYPGAPSEGAKQKTGRLWIEYVSVSKQVNIDYKSEDQTVKASNGYIGTKINDAFIPERDGHVFCGWYKGEKIYKFSSLIEGETELTAKWKEQKDIDTAAGLYYMQGEGGAFANGGKYITLLADGSVDFSDVLDKEPIYYGLASDMSLYAVNEDFTVNVYDLAGQSYVKVQDEQIKEVLYSYVSGEKVVKVKSGESLKLFVPERPGYSLVGWKDENGQEVDFDTITVDKNITLTAVWEYVQIRDTLYPYYYSTYYCKQSGEYLILKDNNDATIKATAQTDYKYYILEPGIFVLVDGTEQTEYILYGQRIVAKDGKTYQRLSSYIITFDTKGGSKVEKQIIDSGDYKMTKPQDPTREGYTFNGWVNLDGTAFDFEQVITSSATVYASWTTNQTNTGNGGCAGSIGSHALIISLSFVICTVVVIYLRRKGERN